MEKQQPPKLHDESSNLSEPAVNTKAIGNISEAKCLARFIDLGWTVLMPFGDNERYDMVIDRGKGFERVQVKTACPTKNGCIKFNACNTTGRVNNQGSRSYRGDIEYFGVYYDDVVYLVPVDEVGETQVWLRIDTPKLSNPNIRLAEQYKV